MKNMDWFETENRLIVIVIFKVVQIQFVKKSSCQSMIFVSFLLFECYRSVVIVLTILLMKYQLLY